VAGEFDSAWLKWAWASAHAEVLKAEIRDNAIQFERQGGVTAVSRYDSKHHCVFVIARTIPSLPTRTSLILGDVIHAYRSSLDQLAWALVKRGKTPNLTEKKARGVYFPFQDTRIGFNDCLKARLPGVRRTDIAKIRRYQPYKTRKRNLSRHPLRTLAKLSNHDKHRTVQPLFAVPVGVRFQVKEAHDCVVTRLAEPGRPKRLEVGREITRIYVRRTGPDPYVELEGAISVEPFVDDFMFLSDWLPKTSQLTGSLLRDFAEPPEDLLDTIALSGGGRGGH
jgi:hypothetical protein